MVGDVLEGGVDVAHRERRVRGGRRQRAQRCPAHPGPALPQAAGQVGDDQGELRRSRRLGGSAAGAADRRHAAISARLASRERVAATSADVAASWANNTRP